MKLDDADVLGALLLFSIVLAAVLSIAWAVSGPR